jgi:hypothetical protein
MVNAMKVSSSPFSLFPWPEAACGSITRHPDRSRFGSGLVYALGGCPYSLVGREGCERAYLGSLYVKGINKLQSSEKKK